MKPDEIERLLGGYATNTLSEKERRALFGAALTDQRLFDALMREQALRELLADPHARRRVLEALGPSREPYWRRVWDWMRQPAAMALAGSAAVALIAVGIVLQKGSKPTVPAAEVAEVREPASPAPAAQPRAEAPAPHLAPREARRAPPPRATTPPPAQPPAPAKAGGAETAASAGVAAPPPQPALTRQLAASPAPPPARVRARDLYLRTLAGPAPGFMAGEPAAGARLSLSSRETSARKTEAAVPVADLGPPPLSHLGVRYRILRRDSAGRYDEIDPTAPFRPGDQVRLIFEPNDSGYLYILQREASGGWNLLWSGGVQKATALEVPPAGALSYEQPGRKELFVMLSRRPDTGVAQLDAAQLDSLAARARGRLLLEPGVARDRAVYVVDPTLPPSAQQVAFAITLEVR